MEYVAMLTSPDLVSGLRDLLGDGDVVVVKRTVRVFANVYRHALRLLSEGQLDEATFMGAWPAVRGVAEQLVAMVATAENEGVTVHVVRFLEAALVAHLLSDVTRYPEVAKEGPPMIAKGVAALTQLISTPYIGGSAFLVGVRALITVACYKKDLWAPVTDLIERQIASPPPTLFDHNVRSLHKTLQRNLFRLLRRAETPKLRSQLIEMMVSVGVPRRMLSQWAPPPEARKRPAQSHSEEAITGRGSPPVKRQRQRDTDKARDPRSRDPRIHPHSRTCRDPRTATRGEPQGRHSPPQDPRVAAQAQDTTTTAPHTTTTTTTTKILSNFDFLSRLITSRRHGASSAFLQECSEKERALYHRLDHPSVVRLVLSCLDSVPDSAPEDLLGKLGRQAGDVAGIREQLTALLAPHIHLDFISSLGDNTPPSRPASNASSSSPRSTPPLPQPSPPSPPSSARSTPSDPAHLCHADVDLRLLLNKGFHPTGDVDMRDTRLLMPRDSDNRLLVPRDSDNRLLVPRDSDNRLLVPRDSDNRLLVPRDSDSRLLVPRDSDNRLFVPRDSDNRLLMPRDSDNRLLMPRDPMPATRLDPRDSLPPKATRDPRDPPRLDPRDALLPRDTPRLDPRDSVLPRDPPQLLPRDPPRLLPHPQRPATTTTRLDPRMTGPPGGLDPRLIQSFADAHESAMAQRGPGPFMAQHPPPHGYMHGYVEGARPPFLEGMRPGFGVPRYDASYPPHCPPHDVGYMGPRGMGPRGMGGPWQGPGMPHNRMGVMMPLLNGPSPMFSPPMHL